jgi:hypothetical protein
MDKKQKFFYFKQENCCFFNYLILAKLCDLLGSIRITLYNRVRTLIKIYTKFLELEKLFQIKVSKNSLFYVGFRIY